MKRVQCWFDPALIKKMTESIQYLLSNFYILQNKKLVCSIRYCVSLTSGESIVSFIQIPDTLSICLVSSRYFQFVCVQLSDLFNDKIALNMEHWLKNQRAKDLAHFYSYRQMFCVDKKRILVSKCSGKKLILHCGYGFCLDMFHRKNPEIFQI